MVRMGVVTIGGGDVAVGSLTDDACTLCLLKYPTMCPVDHDNTKKVFALHSRVIRSLLLSISWWYHLLAADPFPGRWGVAILPTTMREVCLGICPLSLPGPS